VFTIHAVDPGFVVSMFRGEERKAHSVWEYKHKLHEVGQHRSTYPQCHSLRPPAPGESFLEAEAGAARAEQH
jgi:hypothetical protein